MAVEYGNYSPYKNDMIKTSDDTQFSYLSYYDIPRYVPVQDDMEDFTITGKYHQKPWSLAKDLYDTEMGYWVFALCNPTLLDPLYDFNQGTIIKIPSVEQFNRIIQSK